MTGLTRLALLSFATAAAIVALGAGCASLPEPEPESLACDRAPSIIRAWTGATPARVGATYGRRYTDCGRAHDEFWARTRRALER